MSLLKSMALALGLLAAALGAACAAGEAPKRIAFFGFHIINTSLEPTSPAEERRLRMLDELFREKVGARSEFRLVAVPDAVREKLAAGPGVDRCNGCERDAAIESGAELAAWGTVQKVSNLILNINLYIEDARSGTMQFVRSVDIRGNTDESWRHGLDYMLRHYLFGEP